LKWAALLLCHSSLLDPTDVFEHFPIKTFLCPLFTMDLPMEIAIRQRLFFSPKRKGDVS
jgi:hypothetical protein